MTSTRFLALAAFAILAPTLAGCHDACTAAANKESDCIGAAGVGFYAPAPQASCDGQLLCQANCINDASCDDIRATEEANGANNAFTQCMSTCK